MAAAWPAGSLVFNHSMMTEVGNCSYQLMAASPPATWSPKRSSPWLPLGVLKYSSDLCLSMAPCPWFPKLPSPASCLGRGTAGGRAVTPGGSTGPPPTPRRCSGTHPRGLGVGALSQRKWWEVRAPLHVRRIQTSAFPSGLPGARRAPPSLLAGLVWFQLPRAWPCAGQVSPDLGSPPPPFLLDGGGSPDRADKAVGCGYRVRE